MQIKFKKIHPNAVLPKQGKLGDAAFDLCCVEDFSLNEGERKLVSTGLQLASMPEQPPWQNGFSLFLQIEGRSGLAARGIIPLGGIIDATYRGEIKVILQNLNNTPNVNRNVLAEHFKAGDRIAQLLVRVILTNDSTRSMVEMVEAEEVTETTRGDAGFGSTGR